MRRHEGPDRQHRVEQRQAARPRRGRRGPGAPATARRTTSAPTSLTCSSDRPVDAVGHRVVHGGPRPRAPGAGRRRPGRRPARAGAARAAAPAGRGGRDRGRAPRPLPDVPAVACFDTAFHADAAGGGARPTPCPREWRERYGLRRYGFHGLSYAYAGRRAARAARPRRPAAGRRAPRVGCVAGRGTRRPVGRHHDGLHAAGGAGDGDPGRHGRPRAAAVAGRARRADGGARCSTASTAAAGCSAWPAPRTCARCCERAAAGTPTRGWRVDVYLHRLAASVAAMTASTRRPGRPRLHRRGRRGLGRRYAGCWSSGSATSGWRSTRRATTGVEGDADVSPPVPPRRCWWCTPARTSRSPAAPARSLA